MNPTLIRDRRELQTIRDVPPWVEAGGRALVSGAVASVLTTLALMALARAYGKRVHQPTNATSHWLHGRGAGRVEAVDAAHTAVGFATHHASAVFWALPFERWLTARPNATASEIAGAAAVTAVVAAVVDYGVVPRRVSPGWEETLPPRAIAVVYGVLALGLAAGGLATQRMRAGADRTRRIDAGDWRPSR
ncbi:MAG TPA: hypothetical protein VIL72_07470 [Beijerinckiaceae bacterium]|jgi:hypothetical protein